MAQDIEDKTSLPERAGLTFFGEHWFFHSPSSQIRLRRFGPSSRNWKNPGGQSEGGPKPGQSAPFINDSRQFKDLFQEWLADHLVKTYKRKASLTQEKSFRWIFSENDLIPGLTLDIIGSSVIADITTAPIEQFWFCFKEIILSTLEKLERTELKLIEARHHEIRKKEGLDVIAIETPPPSEWMGWNGLEWWVSPGQEQKTGFYLDQKFNHLKTKDWAQRLEAKSALDLFTFQGGFALHLAKAGISTLAVDQSERTLATLEKNREHNSVAAELLKTEQADIFEWIKSHDKKYDVVILDPPAVSKSKDNMEKTVRALTALHSRALELVNPGGLLVTCTCSQAITDEVLTSVVREAAHQTRRTVHILERSGPSPDHAPLPGFAEGDYLRAWFLGVG